MTDHKFEPGQLVLVRDSTNDPWQLRMFSYFDEENCLPFRVMPDTGWKQCIPFSARTKHLQNSKAPYESSDPPNPPVEYEWGQKVEVLIHRCWCKGVFIKNKRCTSQPIIVAIQGYDDTCHVAEKDIRPLADTAAHADY